MTPLCGCIESRDYRLTQLSPCSVFIFFVQKDFYAPSARSVTVASSSVKPVKIAEKRDKHTKRKSSRPVFTCLAASTNFIFQSVRHSSFEAKYFDLSDVCDSNKFPFYKINECVTIQLTRGKKGYWSALLGH